MSESSKIQSLISGESADKAPSDVSAFFFAPRRFFDFTKPLAKVRDGLNSGHVELMALKIESVEIIKGVKAAPGVSYKPDSAKIVAKDDGGAKIEFRVFGNVWTWKGIKAQSRIFATGKVETYNGALQIVGAEVASKDIVGTILPIYRGKAGSKAAKALKTAIGSPQARQKAVEQVMAEFPDMSEADVLSRAVIDAPSLDVFFQRLHRPASIAEGEAAVEAARRLSALQVIVTGERANHRAFNRASHIPISKEKVDELIASLPMKLTQDQVYAIYDACGDMVEGRPMNRMLTGDVGTGKTLSFLVPAVAAHLAGAKVSLLMPNSLVAEQVARECKQFFPQASSVLVGDKTKSDTATLAGHNLYIGTTALNYLNLPKQDLVVVDEQAKFSRAQREHLCDEHTHLLEASATPIPRSMGLVMGGKDMSFLKECPVEKKIHTKLLDPEDKKEVFREIQRIVNEGFQVAIIYPRTSVEEKASDLDGENEIELVDDGGQKSVEGAYEQWKRILPDGDDVVMVHGKMKEKDKAAALAKDFRVLVASTVMEVGVTKPKLAGMLVVQPERLGTATLHQLRGRLVRHGGEGYFFMFPQKQLREEQLERLRLMEQLTDGFELAEQDMALRGYGDLSIESDAQSGASVSMFHEFRLMPEDLLAVQNSANVGRKMKP